MLFRISQKCLSVKCFSGVGCRAGTVPGATPFPFPRPHISEVIKEPLPLKPRIVVKKSVVLVKRKNGFTKAAPWTENPGKMRRRAFLANPFSRFTKTTDIFTKFSVLRAGVLKLYQLNLRMAIKISNDMHKVQG